MESFLDLVGGKGVMKFFETISKGIGAITKPKLIKMMAEAESYKKEKEIESKSFEIEKLSEIIKNNPELAIQYNNENITIENKNIQEITVHALNRLGYQELKKQLNIEKTIKFAYEEIKNDDQVSEEQVSDDWVFRFFNSVENISDENIQKIWARILAGEIKVPNSYSYRAMEILKNMTQKEIELFQKISKVSIQSSDSYFITTNKEILKKYDVFFIDIFSLEEFGLISSQELLWTKVFEQEEILVGQTSEFLALASNKNFKTTKVVYNAFKFTNSGQQLLKAIFPKQEKEYFIDYAKDLLKCNPNIDIKIYKYDCNSQNNSNILLEEIFLD